MHIDSNLKNQILGQVLTIIAMLTPFGAYACLVNNRALFTLVPVAIGMLCSMRIGVLSERISINTYRKPELTSKDNQIRILRAQLTSVNTLIESLMIWHTEPCDLDGNVRVIRLDETTNQIYACDARDVLPGDLWRPIYR